MTKVKSLLLFSSGHVFHWDQVTDRELSSPAYKFGGVTGLTKGRLYTEGLLVHQELSGTADVSVRQDNITFFNQIEVTLVPGSGDKFFQAGDSGALVYIDNNSRQGESLCVGMAIGYTSYGSCIVTPAGRVLSALECGTLFTDVTQKQHISNHAFS